jgi:TatD DNase family protein
MQIIDTHAHLYSSKFAHDRDDMVKRAISAGVYRMYLPNIDAESIAPMLDLEAAFPENCFAMMGLHPCHVFADFKKDLAWVEEWLGKRDFVGIGETGIDLYWDKTFLKEQIIAFTQQLEWGKSMDKPVIVHARDSMRECIDTVKDVQDGRSRGIFHCFGGTLEEAKEIIDLGFHLGIGGTLTYPKSDLASILRKIPLEWLVIETDSPYLPPVPHRGKRNESAYVKLVAEMLSEAKVVPLAEVAKVTTANALGIFRN